MGTINNILKWLVMIFSEVLPFYLLGKGVVMFMSERKRVKKDKMTEAERKYMEK